MNTNNHESPFGEVIYSYTRAQAVADGVQVEVSKVAAKRAGVIAVAPFPMAGKEKDEAATVSETVSENSAELEKIVAS